MAYGQSSRHERKSAASCAIENGTCRARLSDQELRVHSRLDGDYLGDDIFLQSVIEGLHFLVSELGANCGP